MKRFRSAIMFLGVLCLIAVASFVLWNSGSGEARPNILFITLDTTRADRIGAYGYKAARTPVLDQLAAEGVLFERAISPAPLTLPVHASLFTGLYPPEHGLRTNGYGRLPDNNRLLSEILADVGYDCGAFLASFVLDQKFGLNRGFQTYDDNLSDAAPTQDAIHRSRDGRLVVDAALKWLNQSRSEPFFCWVHLYDPHAPYEAHPDEFGDDFADALYDGEIAYTDLQVGRLLEYLKQHPNTIVIVVGDHGESLGDHSELQHGYTLYDSTQHVPLIFKGISDAVAGTRVPATVSLVDVLPTVTELLKLSTPKEISGLSFLPAIMGAPVASREVYGGTDDPFLQNGWSPLRSVTTDRWRYIRTTRPELYDLQADPQERNDLASTNPELVEEFEGRLVDLESSLFIGEATSIQLSNAEQKALESLGYVGGTSRETADTDEILPDVKDMLPFNVQTQTALDLLANGETHEAKILLQKIVADSPPEHMSSRLYLGAVLEQQSQFEEAEQIYQSILQRRPDDSTALFHLGSLYAQQERFEDAVSVFEDCLEEDPESTEPLFNLGLAKSRSGDFQQAEQAFRRVLKIDPLFPEAFAALGTLLSRQGRSTEAMQAFESELSFNSESVEANINMGVLLGSQQRFQEARQYLVQAVRLAPERVDARFNLGICEEMLKNFAAAIVQLREAVRLQPEAPGFQMALGNILSKADRITEAIAAYQAELLLNPDSLPAHIRLATLFEAQQQNSDAIMHYEHATRLAPRNAEAHYKLGLVWFAEKDSEKAAACFRTVLQLQPDHASAAAHLQELGKP